MANYTVYELSFTHDDKFYNYVGASKVLKARMRSHKSRCFNPRGAEYNHLLYTKIRQCNIAWNDIELTILEEGIPFETKAIKEQEYMNSRNTNLNSWRAKGLRDRNCPSELPVQCECGVNVSRGDNLRKHQRSNRHAYRMELLNP